MSTDEIFARDQHLIQSFANLNNLKQGVDRLAIASVLNELSTKKATYA